MKIQKSNSGKVMIAITFLVALSIMAGCNKKKISTIDNHTTVVTDKKHVAANSNLNVIDLVGGLNPLICAWLFNKIQEGR